MKVVILAAGQGSRMGKLTIDRPKCLLNIGNETVLERQLRILSKFGFSPKDITLVVGYKAELFDNYGCNIIYNSLFNCTDNSYSLGLALSQFSKLTDNILVMDGDLIFEERIIADILNEDEINCILVKKEKCQSGSTGVYTTKDEMVSEIGKHLNNSELSYTGIMRIDSKIAFAIAPILLDEKNRKSWYTIPINKNLGKLKLKTVFTTAKILGINTFHDYTHAKDIFGIKGNKILITGASGFLGKKISGILERDFKVLGISKHGGTNIEAVDLLDFVKLEAFIELKQPDVIIHTVAIADPDICDMDRVQAYEVNVVSTKNICEICMKKSIKLIFISTDYVFDGTSSDEYREDSEISPVNYYGETKALAEDLVKQLDKYLIIRVPILYGFNDSQDKETFVKKILIELNQGNKVFLDNEQIRYPVLIDEVAIAIKQVLEEKGIIQISSNQPVTKYQWALLISKIFQYDPSLILPLGHKNTGSRRPAHVRMNTQKMKKMGIVIHDIEDGLKIMHKQMNCIFKLIYKSGCHERIYGVTVGDFRYKLGKLLSQSIDSAIIHKADCVMPVPNSGLFYAMGLANEIGKPYLQGLVKTDSVSRSFNIANTESRKQYLESKIVPISELIVNKNIILVDEAIFTGTTLRITCDILKACGANEIHICIPTPVCYSRCRQYIQPNRAVLSEQVAASCMATYFRVESVTNISYELFLSEIEKLQTFSCYSCFSKDT